MMQLAPVQRAASTGLPSPVILPQCIPAYQLCSTARVCRIVALGHFSPAAHQRYQAVSQLCVHSNYWAVIVRECMRIKSRPFWVYGTPPEIWHKSNKKIHRRDTPECKVQHQWRHSQQAKPDGQCQTQRKVLQHGKVDMFSKFAIHKRYGFIETLQVASFSEDECTEDSIVKLIFNYHGVIFEGENITLSYIV